VLATPLLDGHTLSDYYVTVMFEPKNTYAAATPPVGGLKGAIRVEHPWGPVRRWQDVTNVIFTALEASFRLAAWSLMNGRRPGGIAAMFVSVEMS